MTKGVWAVVSFACVADRKRLLGLVTLDFGHLSRERVLHFVQLRSFIQLAPKNTEAVTNDVHWTSLWVGRVFNLSSKYKVGGGRGDNCVLSAPGRT